eukprot:2102088-Rhodomonas_salina.1
MPSQHQRGEQPPAPVGRNTSKQDGSFLPGPLAGHCILLSATLSILGQSQKGWGSRSPQDPQPGLVVLSRNSISRNTQSATRTECTPQPRPRKYQGPI